MAALAFGDWQLESPELSGSKAKVEQLSEQCIS